MPLRAPIPTTIGPGRRISDSADGPTPPGTRARGSPARSCDVEARILTCSYERAKGSSCGREVRARAGADPSGTGDPGEEQQGRTRGQHGHVSTGGEAGPDRPSPPKGSRGRRWAYDARTVTRDPPAPVGPGGSVHREPVRGEGQRRHPVSQGARRTAA